MMDVEPQDGRVVRAASRWTCAPVLAAVVRVLALVGLAVAAWLLTSANAHADTGSQPVSGTASPAQIAVGERVPGSADTAPSGSDDLYEVASGVFIDAWWLEFIAPTIGDTDGRVVPVTGTSTGGLPVTSATETTFLYDAVGPTFSAVPGTLAGSSGDLTGRSLGDALLAPLQRSGAVAPLTEAVTPVTAAVEPVLSGMTVLPSFGDRASASASADAALLPWDQYRSAPAELLPATSTELVGPVLGDMSSTVPVVSTSAAHGAPASRASSQAVTAPAAPAAPRPGSGSLPTVPGLGTSTGGASGTSTLTNDSGTGAVPAGSLPGHLRVSRVSPATARTVLPHERAEDPAVSPD